MKTILALLPLLAVIALIPLAHAENELTVHANVEDVGNNSLILYVIFGITNDDVYMALIDSEGKALDVTFHAKVGDDGLVIGVFEVPPAGEYYLAAASFPIPGESYSYETGSNVITIPGS